MMDPPLSEYPLNVPVLRESLSSRHVEGTGKNTIEFITNDYTGNYQILVYGFDINGNWVSGVKNFELIN